MKRIKRTSLALTSVLFMAAIWGFIFVEKETELFRGLDLLIFILIIVFGAIAMFIAIKKDKEEKRGLPAEDEFSNMIKYKSGYFAYMGSMYMWLFVFIFKDKFPDTEIMLGGGILLSALIYFIAKLVVKRRINE